MDKEMELLGSKLDDSQLMFASLIADGKSKSFAFVQVYGYWNGAQAIKVMTDDVAKMIALLRRQSIAILAEKIGLDKQERLEHHKEMMIAASSNYLKSSEAAHLAQYWKGASVINSMTGDNAPTEVHHMVSVSQQQLDDMSMSERTEAYKRMMNGKLELEHVKSDSDCLLIEGDIVEGVISDGDEGGTT